MLLSEPSMNLLKKEIFLMTVNKLEKLLRLVFENLKKQEMEFMNFVYSKAGEFTLKYHDHFEQKLSSGFPTMESVLENVENKKEEERTDIEKQMNADLQELKRINQDYADLIKLNKAKVHAKQRELCNFP